MITAKEIRDLKSILDMEAAPWKARCQKVAELCYPSKTITYDRNEGNISDRLKLYDATAINAAHLLATSLATAASPAMDWFRQRARGLGNPSTAVKTYLQKKESCLRNAFAENNFYGENFGLCKDWCIFGIGLMYINEYYDKVEDRHFPLFRSCEPREYVFKENQWNIVDELIRPFKMRLCDVKEAYPNWKSSKKLQGMKKEEEWVNLIQYVAPQKEGWPTSQPYVHIVILNEDDESIINQDTDGTLKGFNYFPFNVVRWERESGSVYSSSPAIDAWPDISTLNEAVRMQLRSYDKTVDPPFLTTRENFVNGEVNFLAAGKNVVKDIDLFRLISDHGYLVTVQESLIVSLRQRIEKTFMIDQIQFPPLNEQNSYMRSAEANIREDTRQWLRGPIFAKLNFEHHKPLLDKVDKLLRQWNYYGELPEMPEELKDRKIDYEFVGQLRTSQEMPRISANKQVAQEAIALSQIPDDVLFALDKDEYLRDLADTLGSSPSIIRDPELVEQMKQQVAEQQQAQLNAQLLATSGMGAKNIAGAMGA